MHSGAARMDSPQPEFRTLASQIFATLLLDQRITISRDAMCQKALATSARAYMAVQESASRLETGIILSEPLNRFYLIRASL